MSDDKNIYARFISGRLSSKEEEQLKASGEWDELEAIAKAAASLSMPNYDLNSGYAKLKASRSKSRPLTPRRWIKPLGLIAAVFLALLIAAIAVYWPGATRVRADYAEVKRLVLPQGSRVILNSGSHLAFNEKHWETSRHIELEGEALFEVSHGPEFMVTTPSGSVTVAGTRFNVYHRDDRLDVTCFSGKVLVRSGSKSALLDSARAVSVSGSMWSPVKPATTSDPDWLNGYSLFEAAPAQEVFDALERIFNIEVRSGNTDRMFTGRVDHTNLDTALLQVTRPLGLTATISTDRKTVIISKKD